MQSTKRLETLGNNLGMETANPGLDPPRTEKLRRECRATMQRLAKTNRDLEPVRKGARPELEFACWQRYFGFDPVAAQFFENLDRGRSE